MQDTAIGGNYSFIDKYYSALFFWVINAELLFKSTHLYRAFCNSLVIVVLKKKKKKSIIFVGIGYF